VTREKDENLKRELLERAVNYALEHGFSGLSLRPLAEGIGSSARMLIHHFGSKEALLSLMVGQIEEQFLTLTERLLGEGLPPVQMLETLWKTFTHPELEPVLRSIFELWSYALIHPPGLESLRESLVTAWVVRLSSAFGKVDLTLEQSEALAALAVATVIGLLLQRLTVGQEARSEAAFRYFVGWLEREMEQ
jgi:AcrR family transcriptional regulator